MIIVKRQFGPKTSEKDLRKLNFSGSEILARHGGCWINDMDCGALDCPMGYHDGAPQQVVR